MSRFSFTQLMDGCFSGISTIYTLPWLRSKQTVEALEEHISELQQQAARLQSRITKHDNRKMEALARGALKEAEHVVKTKHDDLRSLRHVQSAERAVSRSLNLLRDAEAAKSTSKLMSGVRKTMNGLKLDGVYEKVADFRDAVSDASNDLEHTTRAMEEPIVTVAHRGERDEVKLAEADPELAAELAELRDALRPNTEGVLSSEIVADKPATEPPSSAQNLHGIRERVVASGYPAGLVTA
jgi:hypothetical protein